MFLFSLLYTLLFIQMFVNSFTTFIPKFTWVTRRRCSSFSRTCPTMMPEGPEVRTLVDQLQGAVGKRLIDFHVLSGRYSKLLPRGFTEFRRTMSLKDNVTMADMVKQLSCKGKFIYIVLDDGQQLIDQLNIDSSDYLRSIWITLGMTGYFMNDRDGENSHSRWYMEFIDVNRQVQSRRIYFQDQRSFGTIRFCLSRKELMDKLASLGPDILDDTFSEESFLRIIAKRTESNISKFLMDQSNVAGIGNYILSEALYRANVDPFASIKELSKQNLLSLFRELKNVCQESYNAQRSMKANDPSMNTFVLQCYGRSKCIAGKTVFRETDGPHGRTIWYVQDQLLISREDRKRLLSSNPSLQQTTTTMDEDSSIIPKEDGLVTVGPWKHETITNYLLDDGWKNMLSAYLNSNEFKQIDDFVQSEQESHTIYPRKQDIFNALNQCPFEKVKVVIIGQDPYHGEGQGHGLAFSVRKGVKLPPSLVNIFKELASDMNVSIPNHGNLDSWAEQGVLLLNTVLTVRAGLANSHAGNGWEKFTDEVVRILNVHKDGLVFLLWGNQASIKASSVDTRRHVVIATSHPSPLGSMKTNSPFTGSKCFSRCNKALAIFGKEPIQWCIT